MKNEQHKPSIAVALDFPSVSQAISFTEKLDPGLCRIKVGKELFCLGGPELVRRFVDSGYSVFLDLKFHDIPNTVYSACRAACDLGVWMINVHCLGGGQMLESAVKAVDESATDTLLTGVTVLTSMNQISLTELGIDKTPEEMVLKLATLAYKQGLHGVVSSAHEVRIIKKNTSDNFITVTPGIRPSFASQDDQKRVVTPSQARDIGVDCMVIGRPVTRAEDPDRVLRLILAEIGDEKTNLN